MRGPLLAALALATTTAHAEEVKLTCFTQRGFVSIGAPPVFVVTFDETSKVASVFAKELGDGINQGEKVVIDRSAIMFEYRTADGSRGEVFVERNTGQLMLDRPQGKLVADCRKVTPKI